MEMKEEGTPITNTDDNLKELQRVLTMFAKEIDNFCAEHKITYYMMGGTALGAMRHGGFIPWDDDFDIFMDRKNYLRFLSFCETDLDKRRFYLQRENSDEWPLFFSKVRLQDTLYVEREEEVEQIHSGLFIDVMCLHNVYSNKLMRYLQFIAARALSAIALSKRGYHTTSTVKRLALMTARVLDRAPVKTLLLAFVRSLDNKETDLVGHFFGRAPFKHTSFMRHFLGTPRRVPFEDGLLPVPGRVEDYLNVRFGPDHMKMPSQETRDAFPRHLISLNLGPYT